MFTFHLLLFPLPWLGGWGGDGVMAGGGGGGEAIMNVYLYFHFVVARLHVFLRVVCVLYDGLCLCVCMYTWMHVCM